MQRIITQQLKALSPVNLVVNDISGGCGSMFEISVESAQFKGLSMVQQHKLVNSLLKDQVKQLHGLVLKTKVSE
jgi:stress-induced morphogen